MSVLTGTRSENYNQEKTPGEPLGSCDRETGPHKGAAEAVEGEGRHALSVSMPHHLA